MRGWAPLRAGSVDAPGEFLRMGYHRFPDPNQLPGVSVDRDSTLLGRGYFLLQVTYDPDPPFEPDDPSNAQPDVLSGNIRIVSIGRAVEESNVFRRLLAYKPIGLTDHMWWITNRSGQSRYAFFGLRPYADLIYNRSNPQVETTDDVIQELATTISGPVRVESPLQWVGQPISDPDDPAAMRASLLFNLRTIPASDEGYLRNDAVQGLSGLYYYDETDPSLNSDGAAVAVNDEAPVELEDMLAPGMQSAAERVLVGADNVAVLEAPDIEAVEENTGIMRYRALTRDSGTIVRADVADPRNGVRVGDAVNTGLYGQGRGIYIDNSDDLQFVGADGKSQLDLLEQDWLQRLSDARYSRDSGWNALYTTYTPPGVEIEFFHSEEAVLATSTTGTYSDTPSDNPGVLWWPNHVDGEPGIKITRYDRRWRRADPGHVGEDSGRNVIVLDYPQFANQVIMAEGNVRVSGILPPALRQAPDGEGREVLLRDYNVTLVSMGTIYIDGQLLTPQDLYGRSPSHVVGPRGATDPVQDEDNSHVALLARDAVCLNPTQLVPQMTSGMVAAAADDPANPAMSEQHWELYPDSGSRAFSLWRFGRPSDPGNDYAGVRVNLVALHTGADPGPSGMGMTVYNYSQPTPAQPYPFAGAGASWDPYTFIFVPPGALLPHVNAPAPRPFASTAIAPNWQLPGSTPYYQFPRSGGRDWPDMPFNITDYVDTAPGARNAVALSHRDPQIGAGSTPYWLKKWKIEEATWRDVNGYSVPGFWFPRGAINARVNALIYAQRGSWFVIPGDYFIPGAGALDFDGDGQIDPIECLYSSRFRRYNYNITVRGTITAERTASLDAVQDWSMKWAYPEYSDTSGRLTLRWGTISYEFEERFRMNRDQALTSLSGPDNNIRGPSPTATATYSPASNLPKLPCLPVSPTLLYYGETQ